MSETNYIEKIIQLDDGIYYGHVLESGLRHGQGMMLTSEGVFFQGHWSGDRMHGRGLERAQNYEYNGHFLNGARNGFGNLYCGLTRKWYSGMWRNGHKHGHGRIYLPNGDIFEGNFKNGKKRGFGIKIRGGLVHYGNYVDGRKHGIFVFDRPDNKKSFQILYKMGKVSKVQTKKGFKSLGDLKLIEGQIKSPNRRNERKRPDQKFRVKRSKKEKSEGCSQSPPKNKEEMQKKIIDWIKKRKSKDTLKKKIKIEAKSKLNKKNVFGLKNHQSKVGRFKNDKWENKIKHEKGFNNIFFEEITISSTVDPL